jgi:uncharacterized protein (TIGR02600 family)
MNAAQLSLSAVKRRKAMALVMVITVVALMSILIVAIFSVTRMEYKSTQAFVAGKSAKQLADIGTAIVQAQIQNAQNPDNNNATVSSAMYTHATQPGMARVYSPNGNFYAAYKLYSSAQMKVTGAESSLYSDQHVPPSDWNNLPARYVDLNEPVIRPGLLNGVNPYSVYFPVIDPRAAWNYNGSQTAGADGTRGTTQIEGFSYTKISASAGSGGGQDYSTQVVTPNDANDPNSLRLPMPVEWLYVLEDGTVGALDSSNKFISSNPSSQATAANPIVGRIAFWTDDESCKININTAAEPTFMSSPFYFHERDSKWAHFPPVTGEYQRYPGHPATVALSAVLAPNYLLDPLLPTQDNLNSYTEVVNLKESIYDFVPKITSGGSKAGTRPFATDQVGDQTFYSGSSATYALPIDLTTAAQERLYASVDEMLFKDLDYTAGTGRVKASISLPTSGDFFNHDSLEHSRFFLTAQSRSPEFSLHGLPRVCMWPVADESLGLQYRTTFDNMIALCATIRKDASSSTTRSYFFRRANASSGSSDLNINRNTLLLDYLVNQMSQLAWPATSYASSSSNSNFSDKYGTSNVSQLAIQFFDYIRCTNLYDGILARGNDGWNSKGKNAYDFRDTDTKYTFTSARVTPQPGAVDVSGDLSGGGLNSSTSPSELQTMLPGHGQVSPAVWNKSGSSYKGFGRMFTISEIGFQFICTGDGTPPDGGSVLAGLFSPTAAAAHPEGLGGGVAERFQNDNTDLRTSPQQTTLTSVYPYMSSTAPAVWWSNFPPLTPPPNQNIGLTKPEIDYYMSIYGCQPKGGRNNPAYHPYHHPGFDPANWNMTLPRATMPDPNDPAWRSSWLQLGQRRVQVLLLMEMFCPSLGYTGFYPEWTIVLDRNTIAQMKLKDAYGVDQSLFSTTGDVTIKSNGNLYSNDFAHPVGGHAGPSAVSGGRFTRAISNSGGSVQMLKDDGFNDNNPSGHSGLGNYAFSSDFITVNSNEMMNVTFPGGDVQILIYDTHNYSNASPVQRLFVNFGQLPSQLPVPTLAQSLRFNQTQDTLGRQTYIRTLQGPHYWAANHDGCIGVLTGRVNPEYDGTADSPFWAPQSAPQPTVAVATDNYTGGRNQQAIHGRLSNESAAPGYTNSDQTTYIASGISVINAHDTIVSLVPALGDYRILAARYEVPSSWWTPHPLSGTGTNQAHSFTGYWATSEPGCKLAQSAPGPPYQFDPSLQIVGGARHDLSSLQNSLLTLSAHQPDLPPGLAYAQAANAYGDFDTGVGNARAGPYINKPDEGNYFVGAEARGSATKTWRTAYFYNSWQQSDDWRSGISMTPNRLVSSPVMFGSLPTGVFDKSGSPGGYQAWQTLLFRPHTQNTVFDPTSQNTHPGMGDPCDHYLLDLFFMPVVEPYAISEPLSIAGRINMNYQIMPFTNIRRATGMHAVLKGEYITAIPNNQINAAKEFYPGQAVWSDRFWDDKNDKRYWHRPIDVAATLRQFDLKFSHKSGGPDSYQGLFRSASQICEMHLVPVTKADGSNIFNAQGVSKASSQSQINDIMNIFWSNNRPTGDNVRERSYSNLYARLTTRSNTFRVHVRAQALKKARSTTADTYNPAVDAVLSEYRGSTLLERYIDPNDISTTIPDYAAGSVTGQVPLDSFYRFHALETKRFNP